MCKWYFSHKIAEKLRLVTATYNLSAEGHIVNDLLIELQTSQNSHKYLILHCHKIKYILIPLSTNNFGNIFLLKSNNLRQS